MGLLRAFLAAPHLVLLLMVPLVYSVIAHEVAHGWCALAFGDETAKRSGRLTLNPLAHIDPIGTLMLFLIAPLGSGPTGRETIKDLERYLIGLAAVRNPNLINIIGTGVPKPLWTMPGIGGADGRGRPHKPVRDLARVLGVKNTETRGPSVRRW